LLFIIGFGGSVANTPQGEVVLTSLSNPAYPRLAEQARVAGDVEVRLSVRADGSVESAEVISGPAMLKQAVLESVHRSHFECRECGENVTSYRMVYTFQTVPQQYGPGCEVIVDPTYPQVIQSQNHVTVIDQLAGICDPMGTITKVRSVKCFYLWKCGHR
jgi:TonB family protein